MRVEKEKQEVVQNLQLAAVASKVITQAINRACSVVQSAELMAPKYYTGDNVDAHHISHAPEPSQMPVGDSVQLQEGVCCPAPKPTIDWVQKRLDREKKKKRRRARKHGRW